MQRSAEFCLQALVFSLLHGVIDAHKNYVEQVGRCGSIFFSTLSKGFEFNLAMFLNTIALSWRNRILNIKSPKTFYFDNFKTL